MEIIVSNISDIMFKYSWPIRNYKKTVTKSSTIDSAPFDLNVNEIRSSWSMSLRFWKGPGGERITNPVVVCLNMLNCSVEEAGQAKIRFQFGVYNANVNHWEYCHTSRVILKLKSTSDIISLGYRDLSIADRHFKKNGDVTVMVKIQIIQNETEKRSLAQDMRILLKHPKAADTKLTCGGSTHTEIPVHGSIIVGRSKELADMILPVNDGASGTTFTDQQISRDNEGKEDKQKELVPYKFTLNLPDISRELAEEMLRYMYCDHVNNLDTLASQLLSLAERFRIQGLKELCEKNLIESLTPENIASHLLIADEFNCNSLKRAGLAYCEENFMNIDKSFAWKIMEQVNPALFNEVCETGIGSVPPSSMDNCEVDNQILIYTEQE